MTLNHQSFVNRMMHFTLTPQSICLFAITSLLRWCQLTLCLGNPPPPLEGFNTRQSDRDSSGSRNVQSHEKRINKGGVGGGRRADGKSQQPPTFLTRHRLSKEACERSYWRVEHFFFFFPGFAAALRSAVTSGLGHLSSAVAEILPCGSNSIGIIYTQYIKTRGQREQRQTAAVPNGKHIVRNGIRNIRAAAVQTFYFTGFLNRNADRYYINLAINH